MFPKLADIRRLRERSGISQQELADRAQISQSAIPKYENGHQKPNYEIAVKMFEFLLDQDHRYDPPLEEIMETKLQFTSPNEKAEGIFSIMRKSSLSQIPVIKSKTVVGTMDESLALDFINRDRGTLVEDIMKQPLPIVPKITKIKDITGLLKTFTAVLVSDYGEIVGIVSRADLLEIH